jgi:hypothetical protein
LTEDVSESFPLAEPVQQSQESQIVETSDDSNINSTTRDSTLEEPTTMRRTRTQIIRKPERLIEVAYSSYYEVLQEDNYKLQDEMTDPIAFLARTSDPDTMYFHAAIRQPDREEFIKAIIKEVNDHIKRKHWVLVRREDVPKGTKILDSVWAMKRKRDLVTREVYKHKARLNVHGGQQQFGVNYFETYSPVVMWFSLRTLLTLSLLNYWFTRQIDFVLAYPQAPIEFDMYMELPKGVEMKDGSRKTHVLKLQNFRAFWNIFTSNQNPVFPFNMVVYFFDYCFDKFLSIRLPNRLMKIHGIGITGSCQESDRICHFILEFVIVFVQNFIVG